MTSPAALITQLDSRYHLFPTHHDKLAYEIMIPLTVIVVLLYLLGLFKQPWYSMWAAQIDTKGYWQPNVNIVIPTFSTIHGLGMTVTLALMYSDFGGPLNPCTISMELVSYILLHCLHWSKTWVTLYAMPARVKGPHLVHPGTGTSMSRFSSPYLFNSVIFLGYTVPIVGGLILTALVHRSTTQAHQDYLDLIANIYSSKSNSLHNPTPTNLLSYRTVLKKIQLLSADGKQTYALSRYLIIGLIIAHMISLMIFLWASLQILRALFIHVVVHQRCILNRRKALSLELGTIQSQKPQETSKSQGTAPQSPILESNDSTPVISDTIDERDLPKIENKLTFKDWKAWIPSLKRETGVGAELWESDLMQHLDGKDQVLQSNLEQRFLRLRQYFTNTAWQAIVICAISNCYMVLALSFVFNWSDAPNRISYAQLNLIQLKYAGLIWTIGGLLLASLHAIVAYSPSINDSSDHLGPKSNPKERPESSLFEMQTHRKPALPYYSPTNPQFF